MTGVPGTESHFQSRRKEVSALFPYAARLVQDGQRRMIEVVLLIASKSPPAGFIWNCIRPSIAFIFDESSPPSLNPVIIFTFPRANHIPGSSTPNAIYRWNAAVLATPYSEAVGQSVVDALLQISYFSSLRPHISIEIWAWLKRQPSLPPICPGRSPGTDSDVVRHIQGLGDIEILRSYFLLVWSEWDDINLYGISSMKIAIREEFSGIALWRYRNDLTERLDHVLEQLDRGVEYLKQHNPRISEYHIPEAERSYRRLKETLDEVDREAMKTLSRTPPNLTRFDENANAWFVCRILPALRLCPASSLPLISHSYQVQVSTWSFSHPPIQWRT